MSVKIKHNGAWVEVGGAPATSATWGNITGSLSSQTDLQAALDAKLSLSGGTLTGDFTVNKSNPTITLKESTASGDSTISFKNSSGTELASVKCDDTYFGMYQGVDSGLEFALDGSSFCIYADSTDNLVGAHNSLQWNGNEILDTTNIIAGTGIAKSVSGRNVTISATAATTGAQIIQLEDNTTQTAGVWLAKIPAPFSAVTSLVDGQLFLYKITIAGANNTTLNITTVGGVALGAKAVYSQGTTPIRTKFGVNQYLILSYNTQGDCFRVVNNYDTDTNYTAGDNIQINNNVISATDTTYTAGTNIAIDTDNKISATDTTYTAGTNISIDANNIISATDTTYVDGTGISIIGNVINVDSTVATAQSVTDETSARVSQDNILSDRIDNLESRGRFLSSWNSVTGKPTTYPEIPESATYPYTYTYRAGDYYIVSLVSATLGRYKPDGSSITKASASDPWVVGKVAETEEIAAGDVYTYDGTNWVLNKSGKTVAWGNIGGNISSQTDLQTALNAKQNTLTAGDNITISGNTISATNTTYNISDGQCTTASSTAAKKVRHYGYTLTINTYLVITMVNANSVQGAITLNINETGDRPIWINGSASSAVNYTLPAGTYLVYYDGNEYYFNTNALLPGPDHSRIYHVFCNTSAATIRKDIYLSNYSLVDNSVLVVKFSYGNTVASNEVMISVNGANAVRLYNCPNLSANSEVLILYRSSSWYVLFVNDPGVTHVNGVKGNAETEYRTGHVNLTAANIRAVDTTGDTMTGTLTLYDGLKIADAGPGISTVSNTGSLNICGSTDVLNGGNIRLYSTGDVTFPGAFALNTTDGSQILGTEHTLLGRPNGTLLWTGYYDSPNIFIEEEGRYTATRPNDYIRPDHIGTNGGTFRFRGLKYTASIGYPGGLRDTLFNVFGTAGWNEDVGGKVVEFAMGSDAGDGIFYRTGYPSGTEFADWSEWQELSITKYQHNVKLHLPNEPATFMFSFFNSVSETYQEGTIATISRALNAIGFRNSGHVCPMVASDTHSDGYYGVYGANDEICLVYISGIDHLAEGSTTYHIADTVVKI